jgi:hypothetical protein
MRRYAFHLTLHEFVELGTWMRDLGMADLSWDAAAMELTSMSNAECTQVMLQHSYKDHQDIRMRELSESAKHRGRWLTPLGLGSLFTISKILQGSWSWRNFCP